MVFFLDFFFVRTMFRKKYVLFSNELRQRMCFFFSKQTKSLGAFLFLCYNEAKG